MRACLISLVALCAGLAPGGCGAEEQMKALRAENMRLLAEVEEYRARLIARERTIDNCKTAIAGAGAMVTELRDQLQAAESEASKARRQVRGSEQLAAEAQLAAEDYRRQLIEIRREVENLKASLQSSPGELGSSTAPADEESRQR